MREEKIKYLGIKGMPILAANGNAEKVNRGTWGKERPVIDYKKCVGCKICYVYCPEAAIRWINGKPKINYRTCKRCLLCWHECPVKAIKLEEEK